MRYTSKTHTLTHIMFTTDYFQGEITVCLYRLLKVHSCQIKISEQKNQTPVRGQDGKISDTLGKDLFPVLDPLYLIYLLR